MSAILPGKAVFIHVPKTGGTAIRSVLSGCEQGSFFHDFAIDVRAKLPDWDELFSFAFVRNPWERAVSIYLMWDRVSQYGEGFYLPDVVKRFQRFIHDPSTLPIRRGMSIIVDYRIPQSDFICDNHTQIVEFIGRYENLHADWASIAARFGLETELPRINASPWGYDYHDFYDDETKDIVYRDHGEDIERFGYLYKSK